MLHRLQALHFSGTWRVTQYVCRPRTALQPSGHWGAFAIRFVLHWVGFSVSSRITSAMHKIVCRLRITGLGFQFQAE